MKSFLRLSPIDGRARSRAVRPGELASSLSNFYAKGKLDYKSGSKPPSNRREIVLLTTIEAERATRPSDPPRKTRLFFVPYF